MPVPGNLDKELKEFWAANPWQIVSQGHNLSAFERNRAYLNVGGREFLEISHLTGADSDGDGRSAVAADFRNTGLPDLLVRQAGGGALLYFENRFQTRSYLSVSLAGRTSNRAGIGARLEAVAGGRTIVREMYPANSYFSQAPNRVLFGLGDSKTVERLTVRWPSGKVQVFSDVAADRHVIVDEGVEGREALRPFAPVSRP